MDKQVFNKDKFSSKELELIELLKHREMSRDEIVKAGFPYSVEFLDRCNNHGILIYQSDDIGSKQRYGILSKESKNA